MEDLSPLNDFPSPLNGFSPHPVDGEDEDDNDHFDFGIGNTSYDLTGLSEKMNSLEFDQMKSMPPREILELKKESSELNNLYSNNLKIEAAEHMLPSKNNNDGISDNKENFDMKGSFSSNELYDNSAFNGDDLEDGNVVIQDLKSSLLDEIVASGSVASGSESNISNDSSDSDSNNEDLAAEVELVVSENKCQADSTDIQTDLIDDTEIGENVARMINDEDLFEKSSVNIGGIDDKGLFEKPSVNNGRIEYGEIFEKSTILNDPPEKLPVGHFDQPIICSQEMDQENEFPAEDEWGHFPEEKTNSAGQPVSWNNFEAESEGEWGDFGNISTTHEIDDRTMASEVRDIEFDDFSDDEFGDFGLADETNTKPVPIQNKLSEFSLPTQLEKFDGVGENLINTVYGRKSKAWIAEENHIELELEKNVLGDTEVFQPMENPALTPGLEYKWRDSTTYTIMLNTLGIDSRVVLDGENWRSSVPRYAPKTAATLLTPGLLTPEPVTSPTEKPEETPQEIKDTGTGGVTPAQFDWNNSGLTNPLEENGVSEVKPQKLLTETPKVITEILATQNNQITASSKSGSILQKHTSREAKNILDGFPLLNFMTSSVLMIPSKSIDKKTRKPKPD